MGVIQGNLRFGEYCHFNSLPLNKKMYPVIISESVLKQIGKGKR